MRVLLVAYEFPPSSSPRALRWRYLVRELALAGHEVHVLVPDVGEPEIAFPQAPGKVVLHRTFPGPCGWLVATARRRHAARDTETFASPTAGVTLNWRGRMVEAIKRLAGHVLFPDVRAEWNPWARHALRTLIASLAPDVVVTSHEPASTLLLGLHARRFGVPWVADLGDPVCAPYTPPRWRRRALELEAQVCAAADRVVVTTEATRDLLVQRHGAGPDRCVVLANGYDDREIAESGPALAFDDAFLELVYAGRLYGYRDPTSLIEAVSRTPGVRLTLVVPDPPTGGGSAIAVAGERLRVLGPLPHPRVLRLQRDADVLVNVGNRDMPVQIPAKLYEYLGIARPLLHVDTGEMDVAAEFLRGRQRGWICRDDADGLARLLGSLVERKRAGTLEEGLDLAPVAEFAHSTRGRRLEVLLRDATMDAHPGGQAAMTRPANRAS